MASVSTAFWWLPNLLCLLDITWRYRPHSQLPSTHLQLDVPQESENHHVPKWAHHLYSPPPNLLLCQSSLLRVYSAILTQVPKLETAVSCLWASLSHPIIDRVSIKKSRRLCSFSLGTHPVFLSYGFGVIASCDERICQGALQTFQMHCMLPAFWGQVYLLNLWD